MLDVCHINAITRGKDIYEIVNLSLDEFNIDRKNICSITTDGAPALTGQHNGFISCHISQSTNTDCISLE